MKRCRDEPHILPAVVSQETYSNADNEALVALPRENSLKAAMRRLRKRDQPRLPRSLEDMENIPEEYQLIDGDRWLLHDSGNEEGRFLIFGMSSTIEVMSRSDMWFLDGTFKSRPLLFAQLYVIHYRCDDHVIPGLFVLMENKREQLYTSVFEKNTRSDAR